MTAFGEMLEGTLGRLLEWRSATGYEASSFRRQIAPFIAYCGERWPDASAIGQEMVDGWLAARDLSTNGQIKFISCVREYARFAVFEGRVDFVPGEEYSLSKELFHPYLFADDELAALFRALDSHVGRAGGKRLLPEFVVPVWSRLLYCCGMRPQEPGALLRSDVDVRTGDLYIRQTKRSRDRHIIMSGDMSELCARYDELAGGGRTWFFERYDGRPYEATWFRRAWNAALAESGVAWRGSPRPYDLRHAFATRNLARWIDGGNDVMSLVPALSAYLGNHELAIITTFPPMPPRPAPRREKVVITLMLLP